MATPVIRSSLMGLAAALASGSALAATPTLEQMWQQIQQQQQEIERLKNRNQQLEQRVEATGDAVEEVHKRNTAAADSGTGTGTGDTVIGGYGELHYNNLDNQLAGGSDKKELDFHRFVLFFGHEFTDDIRFFSELEVEHALVEGGEDSGEVELEQAYVEFDLNDKHRAKGGVFLLPVGILNETHEPNTFYGTERNPVESNIIPTTWWAAGAALSGEVGAGWSYDVAVHEGLNTSASSNYAVRSGRQKSAKAAANDLAATARLKWTAIPGLELAATVQHQADITQGTDPNAGGANLFETHAVWQSGPFGLRALYAMWDLDGSGPEAVGADEQMGWYVEPSYKITEQLGLFARYNEWDNRAGDSADSEYTQVDVGVNYWPHPDVVIKADYQDQTAPTGANEYDGFNLGIGYQF